MKFSNNNLTQTIISVSKPLVFINKIVFVTGDKNWVTRLWGSSLTIKISCIDSEGRERKSSTEQLVLGTFITPYHVQPVMEVNRLFSFSDSISLHNNNDECKHWQTIVELKNLDLQQNEEVQVFTADYTRLTDVDNIIGEIGRLQSKIGDLSSYTSELLKLIPYFRLDWSERNDDFSEEFNVGVTKPILLKGLANPKHKIKNSNLFTNNRIAQLIESTFFVERKLSVSLLKDIHQLIIRDGGKFRVQNVSAADKGKSISPPFSEPMEIQSNLESLIAWYNAETVSNKLHPLIISTVFHYNLVKIHPFLDGNGRLARVITSLILLSYNIPPPISRLEDRSEYINSLRNADSGDFKPLIVFIGNRIIQSMNYALIHKHNSDG